METLFGMALPALTGPYQSGQPQVKAVAIKKPRFDPRLINP